MNKLLSASFLILIPFLPSPAFAADLVTPTTTRTPAKETMRAELKDAKAAYKESMQTAREDFKTKLRAIKDTNKQATVEKIDARLAEINTTRTEKMSSALARLSTLLEKVAEKTSTSDSALLTAARASLTTSKEAVAAQATKEYVIDISTTSLRQSVMTTISDLKTDLRTTNQTVIDARTAVVAALRAMAPAAPTTTEGEAN